MSVEARSGTILKHKPKLKNLVSRKACETKKEVDSPLTLIALSLEVSNNRRVY